MAKNLQVNLAFTADTNAAMTNLQKLRNSLTEISSLPFSLGKNISSDLQMAANSAQSLQNHLGAAMDIKTGNLNLSKLEASLKASGQSLSSLTSGLLRAGTAGEQAFLSTYSAIAQSNIQLKKSNTLLSQFALTMKNTAKWQLSSSILHGLISGFDSAINYAKDLNTSLNNIQIVTGQSTDQMAEFAKQANKAAKELRSTTVAYTDAALIYYQQGLQGKAVTERANTTVKLANVTGESAETVSQWMTAVWNNFDDGSKKLEYYADVMAKLGAETASSADEIAEGFEKFAAVADTVGLSYEYGASALAAVTSQTRQSADVVGTAFKTLFARIQDLELGNTLDDGTTLGAYSEALNKVGINVKDTSGGLKDMDLILDEMGATWKTLGEDQQVALAKSVAGIRQYTQLIALMENYDYFKELTNSAENAGGTLSKQSEIYEESWQAASKNVKASMESMYNTLIPEEAIINLTNGLADVVSGFTEILEAAGGLKTILLLISTTVLSKFQTQIAASLDTGISKMSTLLNSSEGFKGIFSSLGKTVSKPFVDLAKGAQNVGQELSATSQLKKGDSTKFDNLREKENKSNETQLNRRTSFQKDQQTTLNNALTQTDSKGKTIPLSEGFVSQIKSYQQIEDYNVKILNLKSKMLAEEFEVFQTQQQQLKALGEQKAAGIQRISDLKLELDLLKEQQNIEFSTADFGRSNKGNLVASDNWYLNDVEQEGYNQALQAAISPKMGGEEGLIETNSHIGGDSQYLSFENAEALRAAQTSILEVVTNTSQVELQIQETLNNQTLSSQDKEKINRSIITQAEKEGKLTKEQATYLRQSVRNGEKLSTAIKGMSSGASKVAGTLKVNPQLLEQARKKALELFQIQQKNKNIVAQTNQVTSTMDKNIQNIISRGKSFGTLFTKGIQGASQFAMGLSMVSSSLEQIQEEGLSLSNVSTLLMGIGTTATALGPIFNMLGGAISKLTAQYGPYLIAQKIAQANNEKGIKTAAINILNKSAEKKLTEEETKAKLANMLAKQANLSAEEAEIAASTIMTSVKGAETTAEGVNTSGIWANTAAWYANPIMWIAIIIVAVIAALVALVAVFVNFNKQLAANRQQQIDNAKANLELINSNQELASSVSDLTEKYQELKEAGESTYETMQELQEQIPDLIDSYMELENSLNTDLGLEKLKAAYKYFEETGDISRFQEEQKEVDTKIATEKLSTAKSGARVAATKLVETAAAGDGKTTASQYKVTIGGSDYYTGTQGDAVVYNGENLTEEEAASKVLEEVMGKEMWNGSQIKFDLTNTASVIEGYDKMAEARAKMESEFTTEELSHMDTYRELVRELDEMSEAYGELSELQSEVFDAAKNEFNADEGAKAQEFFEKQYGKDGVKTLEEYKKGRNELLKSLQEEYDITTKQAEALLAQSKAFSEFELAADLFAQDGEIAEDLKNKGSLTLKEVQAWYDTIPQEDKTLFMGIDFSEIGSIEEAKAKMEELREEAKRNSIREEAISSGFEASELEMYAQTLASTNEELEQNTSLTDQVALNNLKLNKGLATLQETWEDNVEIIKQANKQTPEYAKSLSAVHDALQEAFGVSVSAKFIEDNLEQIRELANGNVEGLEELQNKMAEDYVLNMDISNISLNDSAAVAVDEGREALQNMLDSIDTSLEIGEGTTLSGDFLDTIQAMLDAGQITETQLEEMMRAKGYEFEVTGWKEMDGPKKTITQTYKNWLGQEITKTITEQEKIQVPIINGEGDAVKGTAAPAVVVKSTAKETVNFSQTNKTKEKTDKKDDRLDSLKDEKDRYHEINETISDTERELDSLSKAKDRAFGASKIALMDKEIAKQKELIENNKKLLEEAKQYYQQDRNDLLSNYGVKLDEKGRISNYEEIQDSYIKRLEGAAGNDELYEDIEEEYEAFKDAAEKYEESLNKVEEQAEKVNDELDALYEKNLEKIEYKVQIKVDIADDDKAYLDFLMQKVEDDAFAAAEAIGYLGKEAALTLDKIKANEEGIADVERALAAGEITPEQAVEKMREYRDVLVDLNADLLEIRQTVQDKLTEAFEGWNEEIERGITKLEHYGSVLENYKNIIDIVGKDMLGISDETMSNLSKVQIANANNVIRATKAQLDANNSTLEKMRQARAEAEAREDEESVKEWDEQIKVAEEKSQELTTTLQEALSNGLQLAADDFALTVEQIADSFSKAVSGIYDDIENMRDGWDRMQEVADRYLETYEKTYEINKLNRKIQDSIDKTDSVASQKELRDLQNEMYEMIKDGQQLSKYDLEYLQKKYDLMVAEQAFKDVQNAKSVVRLQRDSEGNFGYVYTADQGTVDNAEQNYEDKLYAFQEYTHKMDEELAEMYISVQEQAYERMQAAAELYGEGTEAFERERQKILEQYNIDMGYITDEYEKLTGRNLEINQKFNAGVADTYKKTFINSIVPQYQSFEQLYNETTTQCEASCIRLDEAITLLQQIFDKQLELAGQDLEGFEETANEELEKVQGDSSTTADKVEDMADRMNTALNGSGGAIEVVEGFQKTYSSQMGTVRDATESTIQKVNELIQRYSELAEAAGMDYTPPNNSGSGTYKNAVEGGTNRIEKDTGNPDLSSLSSNSVAYQTDYKIQATGVDSQDYAIVRVNDNWYSSRSVNNGMGKVGDKATFINQQAYNNKIKGDGKGFIKSNETAKESSKSFMINNSAAIKEGYFSHNGYYKDEKTGREYRWDYKGAEKQPNGKHWYVKSKSSNKWYKLEDIKLNSYSAQIQKGVSRAYYQFDTGGYTGSWGPEGRLAMLHQKEIVLNAHDTENFLTAIGIVRDISDQIEKNAIVMQYQNQLANYRASVSNSGETLQQEVHITAEFPNATNHNEIEEAFKNLTNLASQYANRKS